MLSLHSFTWVVFLPIGPIPPAVLWLHTHRHSSPFDVLISRVPSRWAVHWRCHCAPTPGSESRGADNCTPGAADLSPFTYPSFFFFPFFFYTYETKSIRMSFHKPISVCCWFHILKKERKRFGIILVFFVPLFWCLYIFFFFPSFAFLCFCGLFACFWVACSNIREIVGEQIAEQEERKKASLSAFGKKTPSQQDALIIAYS